MGSSRPCTAEVLLVRVQKDLSIESLYRVYIIDRKELVAPSMQLDEGCQCDDSLIQGVSLVEDFEMPVAVNIHAIGQ